ncbi:hypothetical protein FN846DRAFT_951716 [Sphaerosporella brunnea]|uniref:Uncharacterized protein n=1 Tax=Sphaerosporella brunnea TaxID=1250544 RepID=A0A5J5EV97_9PEZI|nr:hypothetical protein FN846DRAFT_951716 [Sphaerosporella brunnea]
MIQFQKPNRRGTTGTNPKVSANAWKEDAIPSLESLQEPKDTVNASAGGHGQLAERIRINSLPLIRILEMIHGEAITVDDSPVIMFRPYRALIYYEEEIREWLKKLENMFADNKDGGKLSNDDAATPANENKHNTTPTSQNERFKIPETSRENGEEEFPSNTDKKHVGIHIGTSDD